MKSGNRKIARTRANSLLVGEMPKGCRLCIKGAKLVLFITGLCTRRCYYCPLSDKRKGQDVIYANERPVRSWKDVLEEAKLMDALGTGITGGDPSLRFKRTLRYLKMLKKEFGENHHVHLYCGGELSMRQLQLLKRAGLDEIRFHTWSSKPFELALRAGLVAGVEIPAIPGNFRRTVHLLKELDDMGAKFVNLNELEFSDTNLRALQERGFKIVSDESMAVKGSAEMANKLLKWAADKTSLNVHFCPSALKDGVQLRNRLKRKAKNVAKPYEVITDEGLLIKGVTLNLPVGELSNVRMALIKKYGVPREMIAIDIQKKRLELHWYVAEKLSKVEPKIKFAIVEEYPTFDRLETTLIPL